VAKPLGWFIRLDALEWSRFTHTRDEDASLKLLNSIKRELQVGVLGVTVEGLYDQAVGDFIFSPNKAQVTRAVIKVREPEPYSVQRVVARIGPSQTVTVKWQRASVMR
jgi:hypothetical protein